MAVRGEFVSYGDPGYIDTQAYNPADGPESPRFSPPPRVPSWGNDLSPIGSSSSAERVPQGSFTASPVSQPASPVSHMASTDSLGLVPSSPQQGVSVIAAKVQSVVREVPVDSHSDTPLSMTFKDREVPK